MLATNIRTPRMLLRVLCAEDRAEFIRTHEVSAALYRPWLPARAPGDTLDALFERELARATMGAEQGVHLRLVALLPDGQIAGFFNLGEIVRGVFQNAYASWSVNAEVAGRATPPRECGRSSTSRSRRPSAADSPCTGPRRTSSRRTSDASVWPSARGFATRGLPGDT